MTPTSPAPIIVGGGLAGLSTLYHYPNNALLYEQSPYVGGTARSYKVGDFTFDHTGHLLHLHNDYTKKLILELLKDNLVECKRNAWIYSHSTYTRYPFQANLFGLPQNVIQECLDGLAARAKSPTPLTTYGFSSWAHDLYGEGIYTHFMEPYNLKLYGTVTDMTAEWCGQFVPRVSYEEVEQGAREDVSTARGYNASFYYPRKGGIQVLADALAAPVRQRIHLETSLKTVYWRNHIATFDRGGKELDLLYSKLVSTIPLTELLKRLDPFPEELVEPLSHLKVRPITCVNLGIKRANISDKSWVYFPENKFIFYRVGFPANFTPHVVPEGCSSMYVEIGGDVSQDEKLVTTVIKDLTTAGILKKGDEVVAQHVLPIKYAYVLYTPYRTQALKKIFEWLSQYGISSIGRYGAWSYDFMESAILQGKAAAEQLQDYHKHRYPFHASKHRV